MQVILVATAAPSLNSSYCYILHDGDMVITWVGNLSLSMDHGLAERQLDVLKSVVLAPSTKSEKKVRNILEGLCVNSNSSYWISEDDVGMAAGLGSETESHPYVSFTINFV